MNAQVQEGAPAPAPAATNSKAKREVEVVTMSDGRTVEFAGAKTKVLKEAIVKVTRGDAVVDVPLDQLTAEELANTHVGDIFVRMDFRNGTFRDFPLNPSLGLRFAAHGALQKYGDQLAGEDAPDLDDWAASVDKLHKQLTEGEWKKAREGGSMAGTSVLIMALVEITGKTKEEVAEYIKDWNQAEKAAMRRDPEVAPIVKRIEEEKAAKLAHVDTGKLKSGLRGLLGDQAQAQAQAS